MSPSTEFFSSLSRFRKVQLHFSEKCNLCILGLENLSVYCGLANRKKDACFGEYPEREIMHL